MNIPRILLAGLFMLSLTLLAAALRAEGTADKSGLETAVFAGGCFWSMEHAFEGIDGISDLKAGFSGGKAINPTYEEVSQGGTGHREAVQITYDPVKISYERLLNIYWRNTDPFDAAGQFCDKGDNYRPAIFVSGDKEKSVAESSKAALEKRFGKSVATEILPAAPFYAAEEYHQHYAAGHAISYGLYRSGCGQDRVLAKVWGEEAGGGVYRKTQ